MAIETQKIIYPITGQFLVFTAPESRPASATAQVQSWDAGDDEADEFTPVVTIDATPDTTISSASGFGQTNRKRVNLTSTAGIAVGRKYLVQENSLMEWVEVEAIISGSGVDVRLQLQNDYTTAATFKTTRMAAPVDAVWVAAASNISEGEHSPGYRVRWSYVLGVEPFIHYTYFDLIRQPGYHGVKIEDVENLFQGLLSQLPTDERKDKGQRLIHEAYRAVQLDLAGIDRDEDQARDQFKIEELVKRKLTVLVAESGYHPSQFTALEYVDVTRTRYATVFEQLFKVTAKVPFSTGPSGSGQTVAAQPYWSK